MFYVYALTDPRKDNQPFYIGKGKGRRARHHFFPCSQKSRSFKNAVIKAIKAEGLEPGLIYLFEKLSEEDAFSKEVELIKQYGRRDNGTGTLSNQTDGGDGASGNLSNPGRKHSDETRRKMSESHMGILKGRPGRKKSDEERRKISDSMLGKPARNLGHKWTDEQRIALSQRRLGRSCPTKGRKRVYRDDGTFYFSTPES
jgi:hypothetical protein